MIPLLLKKKWFIISTLYLMLSLLDGLLTYINTPDLSLEGNPLVAHLGFGWPMLFTVNAVGFLFYVFLARRWCNYTTEVIPAKNVFEYSLLLHYRRSDKPQWIFYKMTKNRSAFWACLGFTYIYGMMIGRAVLVFDWTLYTFGIELDTWNYISRNVPFQRPDMWIVLICLVYLFCYWNYKEYKISRNKV